MKARQLVFATFLISPVVLGDAAHSEGGKDVSNADAKTYFTAGAHQQLILAHASLMVLSWIILLPIVTMLSLASSRYTNPARIALMVTNAAGIFFGMLFKKGNSDLYPNSAHSAVGWLVTSMVAAHASHLLFRPIIKMYDGIFKKAREKSGKYNTARNYICSAHDDDSPAEMWQQRSSDMEALHAQSSFSAYPPEPLNDITDSGFTSGDDTFHEDSDSPQSICRTPGARSSNLHSICVLLRAKRSIFLIGDALERTTMIIAFVALCTGIATYWGFFKGSAIFNGIAHWIKGGVFFWLGLFNLGRWCGSFSKLGWAWNLIPISSRKQTWLSCELVESSLILFYGCTNIFLEHLAAQGGPWTSRDLEHAAITVLFIGGGLCGILVEYVRVRGCGMGKEAWDVQPMPASSHEAREESATHTQGISINPLPAMVIFLMGRSMASHKQASMVSTMIHKQWGTLLGAAAIARLLTYMMVFLRPPTSSAPSRPPTELLMSFCLISGGIIFMASSGDTVKAMIQFEIDVMALYTIIMGFTGMIMTWEILLLVLKEWASRKVQSKCGHPEGPDRPDELSSLED